MIPSWPAFQRTQLAPGPAGGAPAALFKDRRVAVVGPGVARVAAAVRAAAGDGGEPACAMLPGPFFETPCRGQRRGKGRGR